MTTRSTYEKVFEYLGTMSNELGSEISEFMNVFKMIHSHQGTSGDVQAGTESNKVKPMGMITEEMVTIYDGFLAKLRLQLRASDRPPFSLSTSVRFGNRLLA